ncbi:MAG: HEAT repeat domain-containing protein [Pseudomonadota bacterium]
MIWQSLTDPFLRAAFWIGIAAVVMIVLLVLQIVGLRIRLLRRNRRAAASVAHWRPVITAVLAGLPAERPKFLNRCDEVEFLKLWLHFQANVRGDARQNLNQLAIDMGSDRVTQRMLTKGGRGEKLLAILVARHLGSRSAVEALQRLAHLPDRLLSVHATIALVQIDPQLAARSIAPELIVNSAWPVREVVTVLQGARVECEPVLGALLPVTLPEHLPRLLQVMDGLRIFLPAAQLLHLFSHESVEVLICALRSAASPALRESVLALVDHEDWRVRMYAAKALGRLGQRGDVAVMIGMLSDREWWVRYRCAQALAAMPFLKQDEIRQLAHEATDRFAGDMLRQVLAEGGPVA